MATTYTSGTWVVREGEDDAFVAAWVDFVRWAAEQEGSQTFRLVRDHDDPRRYLSFAPWDSFEAQRSWKETDEFRERMRRVQQHVEQFTPVTWELVTEVESTR